MTTAPELERPDLKRGLSTKTKVGLTVAAVAGATAGWIAFRHWHTHWGATPEETRGSLPGDEILSDAEVNVTHAITIDAPPHCVWPWLAQMGQGRGGFYSYTALENAVGCEMVNAETVHPEWQKIEVGDEVRLHPKFATKVAIVDQERHLVLTGDFEEVRFTWAFVVRELGYGRSRLIVRIRGFSSHGLGRFRDEFVTGPAHFVMERKMLLTIKRLAEELREATKTPVDDQC